MLILAIIWLAITVFVFVRAYLSLGKGQGITLYQWVRLGFDLFLGVDLLLWGLKEKGIIDLDEWMFIVFALVYFIGLVFVERLKKYGKDEQSQINKGSDLDEHKE